MRFASQIYQHAHTDQQPQQPQTIPLPPLVALVKLGRPQFPGKTEIVVRNQLECALCLPGWHEVGLGELANSEVGEHLPGEYTQSAREATRKHLRWEEYYSLKSLNRSNPPTMTDLSNPNVAPAPSPIVNTLPICHDAEGQPITDVELTPEEQIAHLEDARGTLANSSAASTAGSIVHSAMLKIDHVLASMKRPFQKKQAAQAQAAPKPAAPAPDPVATKPLASPVEPAPLG